MIETVGTKLRAMRLQRGLELDQVAEATKIRPERLVELEADDYSHFPSLTYAKSFLSKYGQFLEVDIRDELENFRVSHSISLAEYQYLRSAPVKYTPEARPFAPRAFRVPPLLVAFLVVVVLVGLPVFAYLAVGIARLQPRSGDSPARNDVAVLSPSPALAQPSPVETVQSVVQGEASASPAPNLAVTSTPADPQPWPAAVATAAAPAVGPSPIPAAANALATVVSVSPAPALAQQSADAPAPAPTAPIEPAEPAPGPESEQTPPDGKRLEVRALRRTYIRVVRDERGSEPVFSGYASPKAEPIVVKGKRFWLKVSDRRAVEVRENGQLVRGHSSNVVIN